MKRSLKIILALAALLLVIYLCLPYYARQALLHLYPDIYDEIDLRKEVKEFYSLFYGYELNDTEVEDLLRVQP